MSLVDELRSNATGYTPNTNPYGGGVNITGVLENMLPIISQLRGQRLQEREQEAQFNSELSLRHARLMDMMQTDRQKSKPMNVVFNDTHPDITPLQKEQIGLEKQGMGLQTAELQNKLGNEKFQQNLKTKEYDLEAKKNQQIYDTKQQDMQRKITESEAKLAQAEERMRNNQGNVDAVKNYHQAQIEAQNSRHALEIAQKDRALDEQKRLHDSQMSSMQRKLDQSGQRTTTTEVNPEGTKRTTSTTSGSRVNVIGPNGEKGTVDASEADSLPQGWQKE